MVKKSLLLQCFALISLLLTSCGKENKTISLFYYNMKDTFIEGLSTNLKLKFSEEFKLREFDSKASQSVQNNQLVDELNKGTNLLIANIVDRLSASTFIEKAQKKNVPVIFFNREPLVSDLQKVENAYYVGTDPIYEGKTQAKIVDELFGGFKNFAGSKFDKNDDGIIQVYVMKGELGHQDTELRSKHSIKYLTALGYNVQVVETKGADWNREKAFIEFGKSYPNIISKDGKFTIELLLSNNDDMGFGVVDYLKTLPSYDINTTIFEQYFPIVGVNGMNEGIKAVANGELYGTVTNEFEKQSDAIYSLAMKILNNESLDDFKYEFDDDKFIHIEGRPITFSQIKELKSND